MNASIILPAYNEGENIAGVIKKIKQTGKYEIIVVDDGSTDNTLEIAKSLGCNCVRLNKNTGKGFACMTGAKISTHENLVFMDSDGQLDAGEIPNLLQHLKHHNLVIGSRNVSSIPFQRKLSNSFARRVLSAAAGRNFTDALCGFRAIRKSDLFSLGLKKRRYEIESEMIIKAVRNNMKIKEVHVTVKYGIGSSMPVADSLKVASYLLNELAVRKKIF